jgi:uncharacterized protein
MQVNKALLLGVVCISLSACGKGDKVSDAAVTDTPVATTSTPVEPAAVETPRAEGNPEPSFDCAKAESSAQKLVCTDANLAALDREVDRLFVLARDGKSLSETRRKELLAVQRGWIKGVDDCWKADNLRYCVVENYLMRIHQLRQGYAEARSEDNKGISTGPSALSCSGLDALIGTTYVQSTPASVYAEWLDRGVAMESVPVASGVRYEGASFDGKYSLWTKGTEAMFELPGNKEVLKCADEPIG